MRTFAYAWRQALASLRYAPGLSILATLTVTAALCVMALLAMAQQNLEQLALVWGRQAVVAVTLEQHTKPPQWQTVRDALAQLPGVADAVVVSPADAMTRFRARGPHAMALVEGVDEDVLPASVELALSPGFADLQHIESIGLKASQLVGVAQVDTGQQEFARLQALLRALRFAGLGVSFLIGAATVFLVANTIRLTVYARRDEIGILQLVGASRWFVRLPFLLEGGVWGIVGAGLATCLLWGAHSLLSPTLTMAVSSVAEGLEIQLFDARVIASVSTLGLVLGVLGSGLAVRRFLGSEPT